MGTFVFKWEHPATDVYVTGTFDNWSKSEKLVKEGDIFQKSVDLPNADEKIYYKFVVDGEWTTDHTAPQENDASGNLNNVLTPDRIVKHTPETVGIMSGVAPTSTTAELAKDVPLEKPTEKSAEAPLTQADVPGAYPETPAAEVGELSVNPIPGTAGAGNPVTLAPGEPVPHPSTFTENTIQSGVHDDPELVAADKKAESEQTFSVSPLPAFAGGVNPVQIAPGEPLPHPSTLTENTIQSGVHDDPELVAADKKADSEQTFSVSPLPAFNGGVNPVKVAPGEKLPDPSTLTGHTVTSNVRTDQASYENSGAFGVAPVLPPVVTPEAEREKKGTGVLDVPPVSLDAAAAATIQSAAPTATTAQLAANVPRESAQVPEVVRDSQKAAGVDPEASAEPIEVREKSAVESELLKEVPEVPPTSQGAVAGGSAKVPEVVKDSQQIAGSINQSGESPEAAAYAEPVLEKRAVEKELLSEVKQENSSGEPAPVITAETTTKAPAPTTTGAATTKSAAEPATPTRQTGTAKAETPASSSRVSESGAASSTTEKKKRLSFFGKLKAKLSDKHKP
ncbi:hypothetical protein DH86_00001596 [Scytalidium sp. 3C]|nr:hypothetical protein DH86_00001596 [Scytalidium sp. 3C]